MLQDMVLAAAVNEALRQAAGARGRQDGRRHGRHGPARCSRPRRARRPGRRLRRRRLRRLRAGRPTARRAARKEEVDLHAPPVQRLVTELGKLPGHRRAHRPAPGLPHPARPDRGRQRAGRRDPRGQGAASACARSASTSPTGRAARSARTRGATRRDLRRGGAGRRHPDRAHARVPRPLPRARRRAVADRRRRPRGPEARRALRARARPSGVREVVLATNPTTTGEATAMHIADALRERTPEVDGHPAGQRPARGRRPRVRRRGHARQGLRGAPPAVS